MKPNDSALEYFLHTSDPLVLPSRMPSSTRVVPASYPEGYGDLSFDPKRVMDSSIDYEAIEPVGGDRVNEFRERAKERHRQVAPVPAEPPSSED